MSFQGFRVACLVGAPRCFGLKGWPVVPMIAVVCLIFGSRASAQALNLKLHLPYQAGDTSILSSDSGFDLTVTATSATEFNWLASGADEGLRQRFRLDDSGLALLTEEVVAINGLVVALETHTPPWIWAPPAFLASQTIHSTTVYNGSEEGTWTGTAAGSMKVSGTESVKTPAGTFLATKYTFTSLWNETGSTGYTGKGTTTEDWWLVPNIGLVKLRYAFEETYT